MLTKNFYNILASAGLFTSIKNKLKATDGTVYSYNTNMGASSNSPLYFKNMNILMTSAPTSSGGVMVGTGKTPATADDYVLESPVTSGITVNNQSATSYSLDDSGVHLSATYGIRNTGSDPLEISEIGCFGYLTAIKTGNSTNVTASFLIERTVLETPVVIPPNESRQITYTISLRYPTA